jgi:4-alpha-glucanotransferase
VAYTGTHDNPPTRSWFDESPDYERKILWNYLNLPGGESSEVSRALINLAWSSVATISIAPLQDLLNLGKEARMNVPGRAEGNWSWRCTQEMLSDRAFEWLRELTKRSNRFGVSQTPDAGKILEAVSGN